MNIGMTLALLEALREAAGARLIYTGSAAEYGQGTRLEEDRPLRPATLLGATKACATLLIETYARMYGMPVAIMRVFTPYGPWEHPTRLVPHVILSALRGRPVRLRGAGCEQRDYLYVEELVGALIAAATANLPDPPIINLCSGAGRRVADVAHLILELMGSPAPIETEGGGSRADEIFECSGDPGRARRWLNWACQVNLEEGLQRTIHWFRENPQWADRQC